MINLPPNDSRATCELSFCVPVRATPSFRTSESCKCAGVAAAMPRVDRRDRDARSVRRLPSCHHPHDPFPHDALRPALRRRRRAVALARGARRPPPPVREGASDGAHHRPGRSPFVPPPSPPFAWRRPAWLIAHTRPPTHPQTSFNLAWGLVKSGSKDLQAEGVTLLQGRSSPLQASCGRLVRTG